MPVFPNRPFPTTSSSFHAELWERQNSASPQGRALPMLLGLLRSFISTQFRAFGSKGQKGLEEASFILPSPFLGPEWTQTLGPPSLCILCTFSPESQQYLLPGRLGDRRNGSKPIYPPWGQPWGNPALVSPSRSLVTGADGIYLFR